MSVAWEMSNALNQSTCLQTIDPWQMMLWFYCRIAQKTKSREIAQRYSRRSVLLASRATLPQEICAIFARFSIRELYRFFILIAEIRRRAESLGMRKWIQDSFVLRTRVWHSWSRHLKPKKMNWSRAVGVWCHAVRNWTRRLPSAQSDVVAEARDPTCVQSIFFC